MTCGKAGKVRRASAVEPAPEVDLRQFDWIVVNSSGGKDSQTVLRQVVLRATIWGVRDRVVVLHADLGERVEWKGTLDLAREQAEHYGLRFEVRRRPGGDLLARVVEKGMFPDMKRRWCTSDFKRGPGLTLLTSLVKELRIPRRGRAPERKARILYVFGFRAEESDDRARKTAFAYNAEASNQTVRDVWDWYPIHHWTEERVWADIRESGVRHHRAYDLGMSRASCKFCIYSSKSDLRIAVKHNPRDAEEYAAAEESIGHTLQQNRTMRAVINEVAAADTRWETAA